MPVYDLSERLNWKQACELLGCKKNKFYLLINAGKLPSYGVGKRFRWVKRCDCERLLMEEKMRNEETLGTCHSDEDSLYSSTRRGQSDCHTLTPFLGQSPDSL